MSKEELERLDDQGTSAWDAHDADAWGELFADDFVIYDWSSPEPIRDREGARQYLNAWVRAFPDMRVKQVNRVVGEDAIAGEIEFMGTNTGPMQMAGKEIPPTNKPISGRGAYIARVRGGKVVEFHGYPDIAGMMMQLGFMPQM
jgi:ketosteroid isomerase-like protein